MNFRFDNKEFWNWFIARTVIDKHGHASGFLINTYHPDPDKNNRNVLAICPLQFGHFLSPFSKIRKAQTAQKVA